MTEQFHDHLVGRASGELPEQFFDRFMFNMHPADAIAPCIIIGFGVYPGKNLADGYAVLMTGSEQRNLRFSTDLSAPGAPGAGPLSFRVLEANRTWHLQLGPNPTGMELDVTWNARTPYWLGEVTVDNAATAPTRFEHLVQSGRYAGTLSVEGTSRSITGWYGQRDRSRGVRKMAGGQGLHVWCQAQFPDRCIGFLLVEDRTGGRLLLEGAVMHEDGTVDDVVDVRHHLTFDAGLDLRSGTLRVATTAGTVYDIEADASGRGTYMAGAGYDGWHGQPHGHDHIETDVYALDGSVSPATLGTALTDRLAEFRWNDVTGTGIFEFAHSRSRSYTYRPALSQPDGDAQPGATTNIHSV
jgi:hypothetical protein